MDTESLVQPNRYLKWFETANELPGDLQIPDHPEVSAGYADIYHGVWTNPQGDQIEVAIKRLRINIPRGKCDDVEALKKKTDT
ncbi:hypothetical protein FS837_002518, partial [Tulasnella sp. UAMH 9824]